LEQVLFLLHSYFWIRQYHNNFDVVHVLGAHEISLRPALWFEKFGVPTLCKITGDRGGIFGASVVSRLLGISRRRRQNLNLVSGYIAISDEIGGNLLRSGVNPAKIYRIPNGVDTERFSPGSNAYKRSLRQKYSIPDRFTFLFVGGMSARKQPNLLVSAIKKLNKLDDQASQLVLLGPDRDVITLNQIQKYSSSHGIENLVHYFDYSSEPELFYKMADVYCLPSKSEGMANALLEAMSSGLPSIVTPVSGSVDLVRNGVEGVYAESEHEIIEAMESYIRDNPKVRLHGSNARRRIEELFDSRSVLIRHLNVMESMIRARRRFIR
jgi:glycosyltransferase involved in cell wall biosynthesis